MHKAVVWLAAIVVSVFALVACGQSVETEGNGFQVSNPVYECESKAAMVETTGIDIDAPQGAEDVKYSYIEGTALIAQVDFILDGKNFCYRGESSGVSSIMMGIGDEMATMDNIEDAINNQLNVGAELSGMYYQWECAGVTQVAKKWDAVFGYNEGAQGFMAWLDGERGTLYSLGVSEGSSQEVLENTVDLCLAQSQK